ncbi:MAG: hypothetical protein O3A46_11710 [Candidatus Poribacteria bacterium]|nr:hypothetical protein [Candidatus Poribacteria bacterium]
MHHSCHTLALTSFILVSVLAIAEPSIDELEIGVAGLVRAGGWTRFAATISTDDAPIRGRATFTFGENVVAQEIDLPPYGRYRWEGVAAASPLSVEGVARIESKDGEHSLTVPFAPTLSGADSGVLGLTTERGAFAILQDRPLSEWLTADPDSTEDVSGGWALRETSSVASLPTTWLGWSGVDLVAWHGVDPRSSAWTDARKTALLTWLHSGGSLVLFADNAPNFWDESFLSPFLPDRPDETCVHTRQVGLGRTTVIDGSPFQLSPDDERDVWRRALASFSPSGMSKWTTTNARAKDQLLARLDSVAAREPGLSVKTRRLAESALVWFVVALIAAVAVIALRGRVGWIVIAGVVIGVSAAPLTLRSRTSTTHAVEHGVLRVFPDTRNAIWMGVLSIPPTEERAVNIPFSLPIQTEPFTTAHDGILVKASGYDRLENVDPNATQPTFWSGVVSVPFAGTVRLTRGENGDSFNLTNETELRFERAGILYGDSVGYVEHVERGAPQVVEMRTVSRRRLFWSNLDAPAPVYAFWSREGYLDALVTDDRPHFVGWTTNVSVVGERRAASEANRLLVIVPLDITE